LRKRAFASKIKAAKPIEEANKMKIPVFAPGSLAEFVKAAVVVDIREQSDGKLLPVYGMEVRSPGVCPGEVCGGEGRLRRNGSYTRQVIEGLRELLVLIQRFRCGLCGRTTSCPYSFLVPYKRFTGKLICRGVEMYGGGAEETTYDEVCTELSVFEAEPAESGDVDAVEAPADKGGEDGFCPTRSTVFAWVEFVCKRVERIVQQVEKELVLRNVDLKGWPGENQFVNQNAFKAGLLRYKHQREKPAQLSKLSYGLALAGLLVDGGEGVANKLRAYFLESGEKCADLLSEVPMVLPRAHNSEQLIW
jgi:hypothetical protein